MSKVVATFTCTIFMGILGIYLGVAMGFELALGQIFAISTVGAFIISSMEDLKKK